MTDIRVGQIYFSKILGGRVVVTWISGDKKKYNLVRDDGLFFISYGLDRDEPLIAKYPTWQEAVNSPEFRGDRK